MSQSRTRKISAKPGEKRLSTHVSTAYLNNTQAKSSQPERKSRSKSKNTIPRAMRYELENALVGLCDVWFEEIKPHLVRNNIKLHVHGADLDVGAKSGGGVETSGDDSAAGCPSGDYRPSLPADALGCTHIDPGAAPDRPRHKCASYAGCCPTRPAVSRSLCLKPSNSHQPRQPPPQQVRQSRRNCAKRRNCEEKRSRCSSPAAVVNFHGHKSVYRTPRPQPQAKQCHRNNRHPHNYSPALEPSLQSFSDTYFRDLFQYFSNVDPPKLPRRKVMMKNRSTQVCITGQKVSVACQTRNTLASQNCVMSPVISPSQRWKWIPQKKMKSTNENSECRGYSHIGQTSLLKKSKSTSNKIIQGSSNIRESVLLKKSKSTSNKEFQESNNIEKSALFPNDLIDIIAEKNIHKLQNNYNKSNPERFSFLNLVSSPRHCNKKIRGRKRGTPWR